MVAKHVALLGCIIMEKYDRADGLEQDTANSLDIGHCVATRAQLKSALSHAYDDPSCFHLIDIRPNPKASNTPTQFTRSVNALKHSQSN